MNKLVKIVFVILFVVAIASAGESSSLISSNYGKNLTVFLATECSDCNEVSMAQFNDDNRVLVFDADMAVSVLEVDVEKGFVTMYTNMKGKLGVPSEELLKSLNTWNEGIILARAYMYKKNDQTWIGLKFDMPLGRGLDKKSVAVATNTFLVIARNFRKFVRNAKLIVEE